MIEEDFNIFKWQVDPEYKEVVRQRMEDDDDFADNILDMLISIGEELGLPFEFEKPQPKVETRRTARPRKYKKKKKPIVWVDKGRNTWDSKPADWSTK